MYSSWRSCKKSGWAVHDCCSWPRCGNPSRGLQDLSNRRAKEWWIGLVATRQLHNSFCVYESPHYSWPATKEEEKASGWWMILAGSAEFCNHLVCSLTITPRDFFFFVGKRFRPFSMSKKWLQEILTQNCRSHSIAGWPLSSRGTIRSIVYSNQWCESNDSPELLFLPRVIYKKSRLVTIVKLRAIKLLSIQSV